MAPRVPSGPADGGRPARAKVHHVAAGLIIIAELSMLAGPYRFGVLTTWELAQSMLIALYVTIVPVQKVAVWRRTP